MIFFKLTGMKNLVMLFLLIAMFSRCDKPEPLPEDTRLAVYPNPVTGSKASARVESSGPIVLKIFDPKGRNFLTVSTQHGGTFDIQTTEIGTYYLHLKIGNDEITRTLIRR